jgi:hypothetical protein
MNQSRVTGMHSARTEHTRINTWSILDKEIPFGVQSNIKNKADVLM